MLTIGDVRVDCNGGWWLVMYVGSLWWDVRRCGGVELLLHTQLEDLQGKEVG